jgi:hypothetical protein
MHMDREYSMYRLSNTKFCKFWHIFLLSKAAPNDDKGLSRMQRSCIVCELTRESEAIHIWDGRGRVCGGNLYLVAQ